MKALIPSHKENKRYLLLKGKNLRKNVEGAIKEFTGVLGLTEANPIWIEKNILSINRKSLDKVRASLIFSKEKVEILRVSGTLKKLKVFTSN